MPTYYQRGQQVWLRMNRLGLGILLTVVPIMTFGSCKIKTTGTPTGKSVRAGESIVTLMTRLEPYVPSPNHNASNDRYTVGLLIHSTRDTTVREFVPIVGGQQAVEVNLMNIIAVEGSAVWYRADETGAYDITRRKFLADEPDWPVRIHAAPKPFSDAELGTGEQAVLSMLIAGGEPTPSKWIGVLTEDEAARVWKPGSSIWPTMPVERSKQPRRMYTTDTERGDDGKARVKSLGLIGHDGMLNAAFVRSERMGGILHVAGNGFLLLYESRSYNGSTMVARVDGAGKLLWTADTGIGKLKEILPDAKFPAFVGERVSVPDVVSEPILVIIDADSGTSAVHSLWLK